MSTINKKVQELKEPLQPPEEAHKGIDLLNQLAYEMRHTDAALSMQKSTEALAQAEAIEYQQGIAEALLNIGFAHMVQANYSAAFQMVHKATALFETLKDIDGHAHALYNTGVVYSRIGEYNKSLELFEESLHMRQSSGDGEGEAACYMQLAYINERFGKDEEAINYYNKCLQIRRVTGDKAGIGAALLGVGIIKQKQNLFAEAEATLVESLAIREEIGETHGWLVSMNYLGEFYLAQNKLMEAERCLGKAIEKAEALQPPFAANLCRLYNSIAKVHLAKKDMEQAFPCLQKALATALESNLKYLIYDLYLTLSQVYKQIGDYEAALEYYEKYHASKEEIINLSASTKLKNLELTNEIAAEKKEAEIHRLRHIELKAAYEQLQKTQEQLIQAEKLSYIVHLMAGIAHEIQNPLNFVNNFSEVSEELLDELKWERHKNTRNIFNEDGLHDEIKENLSKISYHGKRVDAIVKSMLQHSRVSSGKKEPVDINALVDESLRLRIEEMHSKGPLFAIELKTYLDKSIGTVNMVQQDIGSVLLNIFNNAFYAVQEKRKINENFKPVIKVSTQKKDDVVEIKIWDNGIGIPQTYSDKIFQPFFTTKPTGEGLGLGLSLCYDIVTKGHSGEIKVISEEGEFTEFIIQLPLSS